MKSKALIPASPMILLLLGSAQVLFFMLGMKQIQFCGRLIVEGIFFAKYYLPDLRREFVNGY